MLGELGPEALVARLSRSRESFTWPGPGFSAANGRMNFLHGGKGRVFPRPWAPTKENNASRTRGGKRDIEWLSAKTRRQRTTSGSPAPWPLSHLKLRVHRHTPSWGPCQCFQGPGPSAVALVVPLLAAAPCPQNFEASTSELKRAAASPFKWRRTFSSSATSVRSALSTALLDCFAVTVKSGSRARFSLTPSEDARSRSCMAINLGHHQVCDSDRMGTPAHVARTNGKLHVALARNQSKATKVSPAHLLSGHEDWISGPCTVQL